MCYTDRCFSQGIINFYEIIPRRTVAFVPCVTYFSRLQHFFCNTFPNLNQFLSTLIPLALLPESIRSFAGMLSKCDRFIWHWTVCMWGHLL